MPLLKEKESTRTEAASPRQIKISSKRQITIPADIYKRQGFAEYALLTETPDGLVIQPFEPGDDDELTITLLRHLIKEGFEGEELIERFTEVKPKLAEYLTAIERAEDDIAEGRVGEFADLQDSIRKKYGL